MKKNILFYERIIKKDRPCKKKQSEIIKMIECLKISLNGKLMFFVLIFKI